ncbi:hypothetical protein DFH07DRAFT_961882 [Mycena maculata]|uniref:MYND-type domain-containing protein n=1 Tax=Mycena maculata TaxID=230809 RepID=A0AAD7IRK1_9AGAR|nr:hypothetical protein DFH07DRAFT_961882 [Mycena maculata]
MELVHGPNGRPPPQPASAQNKAIEWCKYGLSDPHWPVICAMGFLSAVEAVCEPSEGKGGITATNIVWPAVLSFLMAKRTPEQRKKLQSDMNTCSCPINAGSAFVHKDGADALARTGTTFFAHGIIRVNTNDNMTPYHCLIIHLFTGLSKYLTSLGVTRLAKGRTSEWPTVPSELLPHGVAVTIESLEAWLESLHDPAPFPLLLLTQLVRLCCTLIIPDMVASPKISRLVVSALCKAYEEAKSTVIPPPNPWFPEAKLSVTETLKLRISPVEMFLSNFSPTTMKNALTAQEVYQFWGAHDRSFFDWATAVLRLFTASSLFPPQVGVDPKQFWAQGGSTIMVFRSVTSSMFSHLSNKYGITRDALEPGVHTMWESMEKEAPWENVCRRLLWVKFEGRCGKAGCTESLQTISTHFQRCTGCGIVGWCSKEHQRLSWKDTCHAHWDVCKALAHFVLTAGGDLSDGGKVARAGPRIPLTEVQLISDWINTFNSLQNNTKDRKDMFEMLRTHSNRNMCFSAGCTRAKIYPASKKFDTCKACGIFRYCNAECQKRGWKDPAAPHKEVCPVIKRVIANGGGDVNDEHTTSCRTAEGHVSIDDAALANDWFTRFNREHSERSPLGPGDKIEL